MTTTKITLSTETGVKLTDDEWDTIRRVLHDWGLIDSYFVADWKKVQALKDKLKTKEMDIYEP